MTDNSQTKTPAQGSPDEFQTLMIAEAHERFPQANGHSRPAFIAGAKWAKEFLAAQPPAAPVVSQHIGWLKQYVSLMDESNWRDMRLRAERQLEELSADLAPAAPVETALRECLQSIADANDSEPREPDDADWRFRFLEAQRAARCTLDANPPPQSSAETSGQEG